MNGTGAASMLLYSPIVKVSIVLGEYLKSSKIECERGKGVR